MGEESGLSDDCKGLPPNMPPEAVLVLLDAPGLELEFIVELENPVVDVGRMVALKAAWRRIVLRAAHSKWNDRSLSSLFGTSKRSSREANSACCLATQA